MKTLLTSQRHRGCIPAPAFTRTDLLVVLAVCALGLSLLAPALARTQHDTRLFQCLNRNRELNRAWRLCVADSQERLPYASPNPAYPAADDRAWVTGTMDFDPANRANWDPDFNLKKSPLWPYCGGNLSIWKCPSDRSYVVVAGSPRPRLRSFSMNLYLGGYGGTDGGWSDLAPYRLYTKLTDVTAPLPAQLFVFLDVREDRIDSGSFFVSMDGYSPSNPTLYQFYDLPGTYHDGGATFSFADGRGEYRRWQDRRTVPPLVPGGINVQFASPNNPDVAWLQARATRPK